MSPLAFYFDSSSCSGCKACQVACKDRHGLEVGRLWRRVYEVNGGGWSRQGPAWVSDVFAYTLSISCNHCAQPACLPVCPAGAISQQANGVVLIDAQRCLGCGYCSWACPYGAPQYDARAGQMTKCNFCFEDLAAGKPPACVAACPLRALDYGEIEGLQARYGRPPVADVFPLPGPDATHPALLLTPHPQARRAVQGSARLANPEEVDHPRLKKQGGERSLILYTLLIQTAVGMGWLAGAVHPLLQHSAERAVADLALDGLLLVIGPLVFAAVLASLFHLGSPWRAYRALTHLRQSWLSREILFTLLFAGLGGIYASLHATRGAPEVVIRLVWLASSLSGLALIYSMARLYRLPAIPPWNLSATGRQFLATTLLLGALATNLTLASQAFLWPASAGGAVLTLQWALDGVSLAAVLLAFVSLPGRRQARQRVRQRRLTRLRGSLLVASIVVASAILLLDLHAAGYEAWLPLGLAMAGELLGRIAFYQSQAAALHPAA